MVTMTQNATSTLTWIAGIHSHTDIIILNTFIFQGLGRVSVSVFQYETRFHFTAVAVFGVCVFFNKTPFQRTPVAVLGVSVF